MQHVDELTSSLITLDDLAQRWQAPSYENRAKRNEWVRRRCRSWGIRPLGGWKKGESPRFRLPSVIQAEQRAERM